MGNYPEFATESQPGRNVSNENIESGMNDNPEQKICEKKSEFVDEFNRPLPENERLRGSVLKKDGKHQVFYHGTNNEDFERFDERLIGTSHDLGWYGQGFYFAYTRSEASYYGPYVREACLAMKNPFYFSEELKTMEGQNLSVVGDMAIFAIRFSERFPELAKKLTISTVSYFDDDGKAVGSKRLSFPEFADCVQQVFRNPEFDVFECWYRDKKIFSYRMGEDYSALFHQKFETRKKAESYRLDMAATYVMRHKFAYVELHIPEYFMQQVSEEFTQALKSQGYDGILQSRYGDEAICFEPDQVVFCGKEHVQ